MRLNPAVLDVWVFRRRRTGVEYLVLQSSELEAERYFDGGRFWQIPSGVFKDGGNSSRRARARIADL